jgi:hypothetical protein
MDNKENLKHLLTSLGMMGLKCITTVVPKNDNPTTLYGIAGKILIDLLSDLAPNIASDQILKIKPKRLIEYFTSGQPNLSNHDLFKALRASVKNALDSTLESYLKENQEIDKDKKKELKAKIISLKELINNQFDNNFINIVTDDIITNFIDGKDSDLYERISEFMDLSDLDRANSFIKYIEQHLPERMEASFAEILKTNERVWVAYQRHLLLDIQDLSSSQIKLSEQSIGKLNILITQIDNINKEFGKIDEIWHLNKEANKYHNISIVKLNEFVSQIKDVTQLLKDKENQLIIDRKKDAIELGAISLTWEKLSDDANFPVEIEKNIDIYMESFLSKLDISGSKSIGRNSSDRNKFIQKNQTLLNIKYGENNRVGDAQMFGYMIALCSKDYEEPSVSKEGNIIYERLPIEIESWLFTVAENIKIPFDLRKKAIGDFISNPSPASGLKLIEELKNKWNI